MTKKKGLVGTFLSSGSGISSVCYFFHSIFFSSILCNSDKKHKFDISRMIHSSSFRP